MESRWRQDFSVFTHQPNWSYFDSAASCQVPEQVLGAMQTYLREQHANVHRGSYRQSQAATAKYEQWRAVVASFIGADASETIFTRGTTESMNLLAGAWLAPRLQAGDNVVVTLSEHHANWLPWQRLCQQVGAELRVVQLNEQALADDVAAYLDDKTKLIAVNHASNVLGVLNPVADICKLARERGIFSVVDAAQSVAHVPVDVETIGCDALAFSAHKLYGPTGIGALYIRSEHLQVMEPWQVGGGMVGEVNADTLDWQSGTQRFEAGTPNLIGAVGFAAAVEYLQDARQNGSSNYLRELFNELAEVVAKRDWLKVLPHSGGCVPVISVHHDSIHPRDLAMILDESGCAARAGRHCAQPLINALTSNGCLRFSLGLYNQSSDILRLADALDSAKDILLSA